MVQRSLTIMNLLLIAALVFLCVQIFYTIVEYRLDAAVMTNAGSEDLRGNQRKTGPRGPAGAENDAQYRNYAVIYKKDLFNTEAEAAAEQTIAPSELEDLEKTKLDLRLWGTITGTRGKSYAVIERKSEREQQLYQEGDSIEQARIKMILRKKVVLNVNGKDEILEIEELVDQSGRVSGRGEAGRPESGVSASSAAGTVNIDRESISAAMQDINNLMRQIRVRPYFDENGNPAGIMLSGIRSNSIFEDMGLESGDIVKAINGRQIRSVEDAMQFYQNLRNASQVQLQIQRNGSQQTIQYRID